MTEKELRAGYRETIDECAALSERLRRRMHLYGTVRFLLVVALVAMWVLFKDADRRVQAGASVLIAAVFVALMVAHNRLSDRRDYAERLRRLCEGEEQGLDYDFTAFDGAAEKIDPGHPFSLDLDIFGERSLFQSLNRTVIPGGRERLADMFAAPLTDRAEILHRQRAVEELAADRRLRQHFHVTGSPYRRRADDPAVLSSLAAALPHFTKSPFWRAAIWVVPALWVAVGVLCGAGVINIGFIPVLFVVSFIFANSKFRQVNKIHSSADRSGAVLDTRARLMEIVERAELSSELFAGIKERLLSGGVAASEAVRQLSRQVGALDQRGNQLVAVLNIFVLWDIRCAMGVARWQERHGNDIAKWFDALAEFDALCSLAGFACNHPGYVFPTIADSYFRVAGEGLGHPLMNRRTCVRNDIGIRRHPCFMIVTGANMAGKSTYLRTVGVNFVLACVGLPVCARRLTVFPCALATSLRTSDSLADNESYFFAELKRLKMIIDRLRGGERMFVILDEILKGTNSADKQRGSLALVRQFVELDTCGIIATHDLLLGRLHDDLPGAVENFRFEADIEGGRLSFSYKLREGLAENMNACFLMRRMGITVE